ncbi:MAG TPA: bacillithiol biosynthesis BshC, partial [Flavipsychrobacter sp.]|nr:bacillithiol biosynthesis BshC [Flavipsychrobacter sp.]
HQVEVIQLKMLRALKKKNAVDITRIEKVKDLLFPQEKLQERVENFIEYYPYYGAAWIDNLLDCIDPMRNEFLVVYE